MLVCPSCRSENADLFSYSVRPDGAWQIRLIATEEAYQDARIAFEEILASWRWKA